MSRTHVIKHRGWLLVNGTYGWMAVKGRESIHAARSNMDLSEELKREFRRVVDEGEGDE